MNLEFSLNCPNCITKVSTQINLEYRKLTQSIRLTLRYEEKRWHSMYSQYKTLIIIILVFLKILYDGEQLFL
jgi:hypothetical protein